MNSRRNVNLSQCTKSMFLTKILCPLGIGSTMSIGSCRTSEDVGKHDRRNGLNQINNTDKVHIKHHSSPFTSVFLQIKGYLGILFYELS